MALKIEGFRTVWRAAIATNWSGENWSSRTWNNNQAFADAVQETITVGLMSGQSYDAMKDQLLNEIGMTTAQGAQYKAARLVRTECDYVCNQGHLMGYEAAGIEKYIFLATLDLRTTPICRSNDMKKFPVAEAQAVTNMPPMHPNCRSTTMPDMTGGQLQKIKRAARNPATGKTIQVRGDMKYQEWYKQYVEGNPAENNDIANSHESAIIASEGADPVNIVGKIDIEKFKAISSDISTDEVIITDERIKHIKEHHPGDFEAIEPYIGTALENPDYILDDNNRPKTGLILKAVDEGDLRFQMVLRVHTSTENPEFKNSILSAWTINESRWKNYTTNKKILYKRE